MDLLYIWYDNRYWSKILFDSNPTPAFDLKVKVTDLEICVKVLCLSFSDLLISISLYGFTLYLAWL